MESRLVLFTAHHANKSRDELLGQGIASFSESQQTQKMLD